MNVLFAEDYRPLQALISELLNREGHSVEVFDDGRALLARLDSENSFGAIVTDHSMPFVTGLEVLRHVRKDARFEHVPVVVCSTDDNPVFASHIGKEGGVFVWKSSDIKTLSSKLHAAITTKRR